MWGCGYHTCVDKHSKHPIIWRQTNNKRHFTLESNIEKCMSHFQWAIVHFSLCAPAIWRKPCTQCSYYSYISYFNIVMLLYSLIATLIGIHYYFISTTFIHVLLNLDTILYLFIYIYVFSSKKMKLKKKR